MTAEPLSACRRCSSPFLVQCAEWRVVRCASCSHLHIVDEAWQPTEVSAMPAVTTIAGRDDLPEDAVVATRFTPRRVCQWLARRPPAQAEAEPDAVAS